MKNYLKVDSANRLLIMDKTFAKNATIVGTTEYEMLQRAKADYQNYTVIRRHIKNNPHKESYKGLTYKYMEAYIRSHESSGSIKDRLAEFWELRLISQCHSAGHRYSTIKAWFIEKYPEIKEFGMPKIEEDILETYLFSA